MPECSVGAFLFLDLYWTFFFFNVLENCESGCFRLQRKAHFFFFLPHFSSLSFSIFILSRWFCIVCSPWQPLLKGKLKLLYYYYYYCWVLLSTTDFFFPLPLYFQFKHLASFQTLLNADAAVLSCDAGRLLAGGLLPHDQVYYLTQPERKVSAHRPHRSWDSQAVPRLCAGGVLN